MTTTPIIATPSIESSEDLRRIAQEWKRGEFTYGEDPLQIEHDNRRRSAFAAVALLAYVKEIGPDTLSTAVSDLLCDLRHLCDRLVEDNEDTDRVEPVNFENSVQRSERNYYAEIQGLP